MNSKIKKRIARKVERQLLGSFQVEEMFSYYMGVDFDYIPTVWEDWTLD